MSIEEKISKYKKTLDLFPNPQEKYQYLIEQAKKSEEFPVELRVDDICDSGETFERLSNYIKENINHECEVRFSALWWNNECDFEPHYYTRDLAKDTEDVWIFFPHENWWEEGSIS